MFADKAGATNIRLGWKGLPGTNTRAYYGPFIGYGCKRSYGIGHWSHLEVSLSSLGNQLNGLIDQLDEKISKWCQFCLFLADQNDSANSSALLAAVLGMK